MSTKSRNFPPRFRSDSRYYHILEEVSGGDLFWGFLTSAGSTRLMYKNAYARARERYENRLALERLEKCKYVRREEKDGRPIFFVTKEGKRALELSYTQTAQAKQRPERWDGLWRIISYDFPENERSWRNSLRYVLEKSGFLQIQKSVWIFPHDAPLLNELLAKDAVINAHTLYMKVANISTDEGYKKHFKLK